MIKPFAGSLRTVNMFQWAKMMNFTADKSKVHQASIPMLLADAPVSFTLQCFVQPSLSISTSLGNALILVARHKKIFC